MTLVHLKNLSATNPVEDTPLVMVSGTKILVVDTSALKVAMDLGRKAGERLKQLFKEK